MSTRSVRSHATNTSHTKYGAKARLQKGRGGNQRMLAGRIYSGIPGDIELATRGFMKFDFDGYWANVEKVTEAYLDITIAGGGDYTTGNAAWARVQRVVRGFTAGNSSTFTGSEYIRPKLDWNTKGKVAVGAGTPGDVVSIPIMGLLRKMGPKRVRFAGYGNGKNYNDTGFMVTGLGEGKRIHAFQYWSSDAATAGNRPTVRIIYEPVNTAPVAGLVTPSGNESKGFSFTGTHTDVDSGDFMTQVRVQVKKATKDWNDPKIINVIRSIESHDGTWELTAADYDASELRKGVNYEARCRVYDRKQEPSAWSGTNPFVVIANSPTCTAHALGSVATMDGVLLEANFTVDSAAVAVKVDVQVGTRGFSVPLWTHSYPPTLEERAEGRVSTPYFGPTLSAADYDVQYRVHDDLGGVSTWSRDATLTVTTGDPEDEGLLELTTAYSAAVPATRILLCEAKTGSNRGPKVTPVAIIEDAANIGIKWVSTGVGELFFTLPVTHPQVSVIEPMTTHYRVEQYRQGRWKRLAYGLIRDFDATQDEVVFLGVDYLGLLSFSVEAAKQSAKKPKKNISPVVTRTDGSRYYKKKVKKIIRDQLNRARKQDSNSPVKFIQVGRIDNFDTQVTIYASFAERLNFIRGLIDSHKGGQTNGEERRSRLRVRYRSDLDGGLGGFVFEALDNVGTDRDNLRLEYGSLIQGYQVIALDDFATRIYGTGKVPNHTLPHFAAVNAPGISQADWGSLGRANMWSDIVDQKDLLRRSRNLGTRLSRVGKRIALGIRVAGIAPFDGYDLLDSIPLEIEDGVVSTSQYGSGYWTIWGLEYRLYPDGHDETSFILRPKGDSDSIDSDLIPSSPIHFNSDWTWGTGAP